MNLKFQTPTGMHDLFQEEWDYFDKVKKACSHMADSYEFTRIETPILEDTAIFEKGTGANTDIVEKEMYSLTSKGGDRLTLRPEGTPGVVRSYIQNGMQNQPKPVKLWYFGPFFRHERPQAGRFRQFHQFGFESLGVADPIIDAEIIQIFYNILKELGFKNLLVEINSTGDSQCKANYRKALMGYLRSRQTGLCTDCKRRIKKNPLRILDCKEEKCQRIKKGAPQIVDHLCKECHDHFKNLLEFLDEKGLPYNLNPYLVRGLDYYTKTVFEIYEDTEDGKQIGALAGGGRYDDLVKMLGGKPTPACGAAAGVERIAAILKQRMKRPISKEKITEVFLAQVGEIAKKKSLKLFEEFREAGVKVGEALHKDSLSAQLKIADRLDVKFVLILGQKEAIDEQVIIREMKTGNQDVVDLKKAVNEIKKRLKKSI
ncbi:MAG: histidine--tRNA ligase [Candidatus Gribaldobacteria bacterium]|nr:histidine--tRNA ligase [Candidatus Gribaldobacteria bacterium]